MRQLFLLLVLGLFVQACSAGVKTALDEYFHKVRVCGEKRGDGFGVSFEVGKGECPEGEECLGESLEANESLGTGEVPK